MVAEQGDGLDALDRLPRQVEAGDSPGPAVGEVAELHQDAPAAAGLGQIPHQGVAQRLEEVELAVARLPHRRDGSVGRRASKGGPGPGSGDGDGHGERTLA